MNLPDTSPEYPSGSIDDMPSLIELIMKSLNVCESFTVDTKVSFELIAVSDVIGC